MDESAASTDVVVVGGGIAGLTTAVVAARAGASVTLLDARTDLGGRARTTDHDGFRFNEGPHALYRAGEGSRVLASLGVKPAGGNPSLRARLSIDGSLRRTVGPRALAAVLGLVRHAGSDAADPGLVRISAADWIDGRVSDPVGRRVAAAAVRLSSYSGDLDTFSADGAAAQLAAAMRGVTYLDGGWAQLVDALTAIAAAEGVTIERGRKATSIDGDGDRLVVSTGDGVTVAGRSAVVAAGGPAGAASLVGGASPLLAAAAAAARPVRAACLDLGLRTLPRPSVRFVLGIDAPSYASVHTPAADLADDGHVVHLLRYEPDDTIGVDDLERLADEVQPGWRAHEVARQIGLRRVVAFDRPQPGSGMRGRPGARVDDVTGLFVAGDWVGPHDLLGGASLASGRDAGLAAAAHAVGVSRPVGASSAASRP